MEERKIGWEQLQQISCVEDDAMGKGEEQA